MPRLAEVKLSVQAHVCYLPVFSRMVLGKLSAALQEISGSCREILNEIRSLTFLVNDAEIFEKLRSKLTEALTELQHSVPHENGLTLESCPNKMPLKERSIASKLPKLNVPDKKKNPYTK